MTIFQYLEFLNSRYRFGISREHSYRADLDKSKEKDYILPLYLYPEIFDQQFTSNKQERTPNLDPKIFQSIEKKLGLEFLAEEPREGEVCFAESGDLRAEYKTYFTQVNLLDYIYAVLHSPNYRETYTEFLKIDIPRLPFPEDSKKFWQLVKLGGELRKIHLLGNPLIEDFNTTYPVDGDNVILRKITKTSPGFESSVTATSEKTKHSADRRTGRIWINDTQYFYKVPEVAWEFYIGGYQPAKRWLKDRKGRKLSFEDILHYQKIIVVLSETDRLRKEIDKIEIINEA